MQWPEPPPPEAGDDPAPRLAAGAGAATGPDLAGAADDRFEAVCDELGILVARRVEPVAARVLPFGTEQLAMVEVRTGDGDEHRVGAAHGASRAAALEGAAVDAVTGRNVLAAALPSAVAEGKVRSAVVFADGEAPVRWGQADDETRLAALYAVVPHLGSFTATAGQDTYRVLRLPGIGAALVSEGASAATWVEGWFAALLTATRYALAAQPVEGAVVAAPAAAATGDPRAAVLEELEGECRRILSAAQDEAREIRASAERDAAQVRATAAAPATAAAEAPPGSAAPEAEATERLAAVRAEIDALLGGAERARAELLTDARREAEALRRETEAVCAELLAEARREAERRREAARRDVKRLRRKVQRLKRAARSQRRRADRETASAPRDPKLADVVFDARRAADDLLADARRAADELLRDAARARARAQGDPGHGVVPVSSPVATSVTGAVPATAAAAEEAQRTAIALLTAATESVAAMSALLASVSDPRRSGGADKPSKKGSRLYFGA